MKCSRCDNESLGYHAYCRDCRAVYRNARAYGITEEEYRTLQARGECEICGMKPGYRRLDIDHDHVTGRVRGVLCSMCNMFIGYAQEDIFILAKAIKYLEAHHGKD